MRSSLHAASAALALLAGACASGTDGGADADADAGPEVTFSNEIVRLFQDHCQACHRPGGIAPFALMTYEDAEPMAPLIKSAVVSRRMPHGMPVRLGTGCSEPDTFHGPRRLTQHEIDLVVSWVDAGAPEGDPADLPPPRAFPSGEWTGGDPDFEFTNAVDGFTVPGGLQRDVFRRFVTPTDFGRDRFITGFEALPDAAAGSGLGHIVHHVTLFIAPHQQPALAREAAFAASNPEVPGPGFEGDFGFPAHLVGMWFPGSAPLTLPGGLGMRVPRGAALIIEVHYAPSQSSVTDRTRVGLHLADDVENELMVGLVKDEDFVVPAGDPAFEVAASRTFDAPVTLYSVTPHMHQLGTDFRVVIEPAGDDATCLADVEWDFEHQGTYWLKQPMVLPAGSRIHTTCRYDNTASNPHQFNDPPIDVVWGASAHLEMCQLTVGLLQEAAPTPAGDPQLAEIFYDAEGADDTAEWVKLHNPGPAPIDLSGYALGWGGTDYAYGTLQLSGTLAAGACVVVGAQPDGAAGLAADFAPDLQNSGPTADGVALFAGDAAAIDATTVPIDVVLYGESNDSGLLDESGAPGEVDVADAPPGSSLRRQGDGWVVGAPQPAACP